ncbi:MAG: phosphotransferase [Polyangiaceae bacterium]
MLTLDPPALSRFAARALGVEPTSIAIEAMPGGASTRSYFRAIGPAAGAVVMFVPDAKPDEITSGAPPTRWPFLEIRELLESRGVRVPRILAEDCASGLLALEDLGDLTLAAFLDASPSRKEEVYRVAVRDLGRAQIALAELPADSIVRTRAFDETLLRWEIDHFREWGLDARDLSLGADDRATFDAIADRLSARIAALPRGFVHRDYQSRNLMVATPVTGTPELVWIDFQDALMGPRVYDLVALLGDSYQSFTRDFIEARLDDYAEARALGPERRAIGEEFDLVTVQRKLKDAGRFVFIDRVKKNPSFLQYVEPTLTKVFGALERLRADADMRALEELLRRRLSI